MKKYKILSLLLVSFIFAANITACKSKNTSTSSGTQYYTLDIDGEKEYLDESDNNYSAITTFMDSYINAAISIDYRNDDYLKQIDHQIKETRDYYEQSDYAAYLKESTVADKLIRSLDGYSIVEIETYTLGKESHATVVFEYTNTISSASAEYLASAKQELNKKYKTTATVRIKLEDNDWKLSEILTISEKTAVE